MIDFYISGKSLGSYSYCMHVAGQHSDVHALKLD